MARKFKDLTGQKFGYLTAESRNYDAVTKKSMWVCRCECGETSVVSLSNLQSGATTSCGCQKGLSISKYRRKDLIGETFGRLTVLQQGVPTKHGGLRWECRCTCGSVTVVTSGNLLGGSTISCGCYQRERTSAANTKHGKSRDREYLLAYARKHQLNRKRRVPDWSEAELIREFYANTPDGYQVDHIVPLNGRLVSGLHVLKNLQYLPAEDNKRKANKFTPYIEINGQSQTH